MFRQNLRNDNTSGRGFNQTVFQFPIVIDIFHPAFDFGVHIKEFVVQSHLNFVKIGIDGAFAGNTFSLVGQVIDTQHHILGRNHDRFARSRRQNVVGRHHQHAGFQLSLNRQRNVNGHLVTVEVGVERGTNQRMQMDSFTFDQNWFKSLNTQTVQRRSTVQQNRMFANDFFQNIPNFRTFFFNHAFGRFNRRCVSVQFQFGINERLKQFQSHLLRQTALVQFQFRTDGNNRTA